MRTVGAYEAKTHLAQLLDAVAQGETITITRHGTPVAVLAPPDAIAPRDPGAAIDEWRAFGTGITLGDLSLRDMIEEGRP